MAEIATTLPKPDIKPPLAAKPPEHRPKTPGEVQRIKAARGTLEQIAKGTPVMEATTPTQETPIDHEAAKKILSEANAILLELRDMRLVINSIATQAADTPLGNEVRIDALRNLLTTDQPELAPLREQIKALNLPEPNPAASATLGILTSYNEQHPDKPIPNDVLDAIRIGKKEAAPAVAQMLQTNTDLAQMVWKDLTNVDGFTKLTLSPGVVLDLAGIPKTDKNLEKVSEIFGIVKQQHEKGAIGEKIFMGAMYGALAIQFFSTIALGEQGGGGH